MEYAAVWADRFDSWSRVNPGTFQLPTHHLRSDRSELIRATEACGGIASCVAFEKSPATRHFTGWKRKIR
jgi:hypothetical protein